MCTLFLKVSIGLFLLRIAINRVHIWVIRVVIVATVVFSLAYWFVALFQCYPISVWWHLTGHEGHCINSHIFVAITFTASSLNSTADWVFGTIPILIVRDLQMNLKTKAIVATLLGFAAVGSTATIVRMPYVWQLGDAKGEFLYETVELAIWSTVELGVGLIAASAATLRPLWQRFLAATGFSLSSNLSKPTMKKVPSFVTPIRPTNLDADGIQFEQLSRRDERATTTTTVTGNPSRKSKHKDTGYFNSLSSKSSYGRGQHTSATRSGNHSICDSHNLSTHASGDRDEGFFVCETCHTDPSTPQSWRIDISRSVHITTADAIEEQGLKDYFDTSQLSPIAASPTNEPEPETITPNDPDELPELQFLGGKDWEKA